MTRCGGLFITAGSRVFGLAHTLEDTGSYSIMFNGLAVVVIVLGIISWRVPLPQRRPAEFRVGQDAGPSARAARA